MKQTVYMVMVDTWRLAAKFGFRRMEEGEWEDFISSGQELATRYRPRGKAVERLCRDLFAAFQEYYRQQDTGKGIMEDARKDTTGN